MQGVHCRAVGLQTLSVMAEDMDDDHLPVVAKTMLPVIVHGISQTSLPPNQVQLALSILTSCVKGMGIMTPEARKALKQELKATPDLIPALCSVISKDLSTTDTRCVIATPVSPLMIIHRSQLPCTCTVAADGRLVYGLTQRTDTLPGAIP